jgi:hypothetical protein
MNVSVYKKYAYVVGLFLLASIVGLWSWNTLAELFNGPHAQYKHAVAAMGLLLMTKGILMTHRGGHR